MANRDGTQLVMIPRYRSGCVVAPAVKGVGADALEVTDAGQGHVKEAVQELPHLLAAEGPHAYLRDYGVCRICFRELAYKGEIPGVRKASF